MLEFIGRGSIDRTKILKFLGRGSTSKDNNGYDSSRQSPSPNQNPSSFPSPSTSNTRNHIFSSATGPARPLLLVYCDDKGKFRMDPEAVATLQLVNSPICVVSVCGLSGQEKSLILNQLLGRSSGFQVASTHRYTKGLLMWSAPLKRTTLDGTEYSLLLLDSEGIDAYDQTEVCSVAVLLSSMFIYNQMGGIDESALDRLSLVTEMTKHIHVRASGGRGTASELGQFSPIFVWLLRDFYLELAEENRKITPRDYLELALKPMQGVGGDIESANEIRESIRALFPDRECFTLVRPLNNENALQRLDQTPLDKLCPEFRAGLDSLTKFVFERTRPKQVGATVMTGPILAGLTQFFLDALNNDGAVPRISSLWQLWRQNLDRAVREAKAALEKAATIHGLSNKRNQLREDSLRAEFSAILAEKENEMNRKVAKIESAEQRLTTLSLELKAAESKVKLKDIETSSLQLEVTHLQEKYLYEFKRFEDVQERCRNAELAGKRATEVLEEARAEASVAQKEKNTAQQVAMERSSQIERVERQIENLERLKSDLMDEVDSLRASEMDAVSKVALLEARVDERERESESLLKSNNEQRSSTVQVLESLLETERAARGEADNRAEALSMQLQSTESKLDSLQQELTSVRLNETALDSKLKTTSHGDSVQDMEIDNRSRGRKKSKSTNSPLKFPPTVDGGSVFKGDDDNNNQKIESEDYTKFTVSRLKQELTHHEFGAQLLELRNPKKKDIVALYEKHVLK